MIKECYFKGFNVKNVYYNKRIQIILIFQDEKGLFSISYEIKIKHFPTFVKNIIELFPDLYYVNHSFTKKVILDVFYSEIDNVYSHLRTMKTSTNTLNF